MAQPERSLARRFFLTGGALAALALGAYALPTSHDVVAGEAALDCGSVRNAWRSACLQAGGADSRTAGAGTADRAAADEKADTTGSIDRKDRRRLSADAAPAKDADPSRPGDVRLAQAGGWVEPPPVDAPAEAAPRAAQPSKPAAETRPAGTAARAAETPKPAAAARPAAPKAEPAADAPTDVAATPKKPPEPKAEEEAPVRRVDRLPAREAAPRQAASIRKDRRIAKTPAAPEADEAAAREPAAREVTAKEAARPERRRIRPTEARRSPVETRPSPPDTRQASASIRRAAERRVRTARPRDSYGLPPGLEVVGLRTYEFPDGRRVTVRVRPDPRVVREVLARHELGARRLQAMPAEENDGPWFFGR